MNISLEQVDQVIDRTGCSYLQARDLLETTNGDVLDAIILWEKLEDVMLYAGLSYQDAKQRLVKNDWNLDSVLKEEAENSKFSKTAKDFASNTKDFGSDLVRNLKELIRKGNVTRLILKREDKVLLDIPVFAGAVGAVVFTTASAVSIVVALLSGCSLQLIKENGEVFDVNKATLENLELLKEKIMEKVPNKNEEHQDGEETQKGEEFQEDEE